MQKREIPEAHKTWATDYSMEGIGNPCTTGKAEFRIKRKLTTEGRASPGLSPITPDTMPKAATRQGQALSGGFADLDCAAFLSAISCYGRWARTSPTGASEQKHLYERQKAGKQKTMPMLMPHAPDRHFAMSFSRSESCWSLSYKRSLQFPAC